ncbi:hypothetical protein [Maridesulfovibrio sp.]|uniref:hypothetical protein n=1 Tax=Maridesulfovibrio sp. TaxID=2795000 RepID=UPI002A18AD06|nr:hypothetical protein [Maridesulfovibrio sp.]
MNRTPAGRPIFDRNKSAGRNLRTALKLLGKTWRKDTMNPNHVLNWSTWTGCGLPSSSNTIDKDMREGVPDKRISAYALCLGLTPEGLCSPTSDIARLLSTPSGLGREQPLFIPAGSMDRHFDNWLEYNRPSYIQRMYSLMGGVYRMYYVLHDIEAVYKCALWIYGAEAHRMLMRGLFVMFGKENRLEAHIFRWHNNLHTHYLCENGLELGYTMTVDPLRHNIVSRRTPFWLHGTGMTDRGLVDNLPITFIFREEQIPCPENMSQEDLWQQECDALRAHPCIGPDDPEYERVRSSILIQEDLSSEE